MNARSLIIAIAFAGFAHAAPAVDPDAKDDPRPFTHAPEAAGIKTGFDKEADFDTDTTFTVRFPSAMVPPDRIDVEKAESPIVAWPDLDASFIWRTQSNGTWSVNGPLIPGQTYHLHLREGLKALDGTAIPFDEWGITVDTRYLTVTSDYDSREKLSARPQVPLEFNYKVSLAGVDKGIWFQDRATRRRFPVEILLNAAQADVSGDVVDLSAQPLPALTEFRVRPRDPLPVGHNYDLIVDHVVDAFAGRDLPYPEVFALGATRPLAVDYVAARNWPTDKPHIEVKFNVPLSDDALPAEPLKIDPAVPRLSFRKEGEYLYADGDFDTSVRYKVSVSEKITGDRGYEMAKPELWGATFHPKPAALLFPESTIRQRAALGLRFALLQANTGPITWKLARIPLDRLDEISKATRDHAENSVVLADKFQLPAVATGELSASTSEADQVRTIEWKPAAGQPPLAGPYLLEAVTKNSDGATLTNAAIVFFGETVFTQKTTPYGVDLRLATMSDAKPLESVPVKVLSATLLELARTTTDSFGVAHLTAAQMLGASFFVAATPGGDSIELSAPGSSFPGTGSSYHSSDGPWLGDIITDRPLYRPGEEVHFKGFVRAPDGKSGLKIPAGARIDWQITSSTHDEQVGSGTAKVNAFGGWDAAWTSPPQGDLGDFTITASINGESAGNNGAFQVEEFRNPPFSVACAVQPPSKAGTSTIQVSSEYFHGAPNIGSTVKWTATWLSDSDGEYYNDRYEDDGDDSRFMRVDLYSEHRKTPAFDMEVSGEASLDAHGRATLTCDAPFKDPGLRARCDVSWKVDVTGPDGQTISDGADDKVVMNDVTLGVRADSATGAKNIAFDLIATPRGKSIAAPAMVQADLFLVQTKTVKELLGPFIYRYRNTDEYIPVEQKQVPATGRLAYTPKKPGRYVLVVSPLPGRPGITVSDEIYLSGEEEAQLPVENDQTLTVKPVHADAFQTGAKAAFDVLAPSGGIAWVTVETDRVLDTFTMPLPGNSSRIEIPIKPGYVPNAHVSVYLLRPGKTDDLPGEMYGACEFKIENPASALKLAVSTDRPEYEPRKTVAATVRVTSQAKPVRNAEVTLYAVDDSILTLGAWTLPGLLPVFFPDHDFSVVTHAALTGYLQSITESMLTQKGVVVGGGGKDEFGSSRFVRENFKPLIEWQPSLKTNADGVVTAKFDTPDNLTRFRVIALAQTKDSQFGAGDATFNVSKPLIVEPALPRFLRQGDEVELRAVSRQKASGSEKLTIKCSTGPGLTLVGPAVVEKTAAKNDPTVAVFHAQVAENAADVSVHFDVDSASGLNDSVEVTVPVTTRTITVHESVSGTWSGGKLTPEIPASWPQTPGFADITVSASPYLPKLLGIPAVLDYPYGCFEQKSSRLLVYTALAKLLAYLPQPGEREVNYKSTIEKSLVEFGDSLLPDDTLPYWPYGTSGDAFVTIQSAWAVAQAEQNGYHVPEGLADALPHSLEQMAEHDSRIEVSPTLRAFALGVLAQFKTEADDDLTAAANELFLNRDHLSDEGRAMLAIALHAWNLEPDHQQELIREIPEKFDPRDFDPVTFSSATRTEAICTWARLLVTPDANPQTLKARLEKLMESSESLSTQENLWLLIAFNALLDQQPAAKLSSGLQPAPNAFSENRSAAAWTDRELARIHDFSLRSLGKSGSYVVAATRQLSTAEQTSASRGMQFDRVVKNLTDATRTGTKDAPFRLGDQILISFRFHNDKPQSYVAVSDALPAGLEVVNPNLEMIGKFYQIPDEGVPAAWLSFSEMRDKQTNLYFDSMPAGEQAYAILARATAAGSFAWPSTQMTPMYDSRFYARTAPSTCVVVSE